MIDFLRYTIFVLVTFILGVFLYQCPMEYNVPVLIFDIFIWVHLIVILDLQNTGKFRKR